jgi:hypothetical protein
VDASDGAAAGHHDVSFYCDDIEETVNELKARGVTFRHEVADHGYGLVTYLEVPGGVVVQLYQPKYAKNAAAPKKAERGKKGQAKADKKEKKAKKDKAAKADKKADAKKEKRKAPKAKAGKGQSQNKNKKR